MPSARGVTNLACRSVALWSATAAVLWVTAAGQASDLAPTEPHFSFNHLAEHGKFDDLLTSLKRNPQVVVDPLGASLIENLEQFGAHRAASLQERDAAYKIAMAELAELTAEGTLGEAMSKALEAHGLAVNPDAMREDPRVQTLVEQAVETARQGEIDGDWVEAASFYRAVDLLYDNSSTLHHANVKRALRRIRMLRLYAPQHLYDLSVARLREDGKEDEIQPYQEEADTWDVRLNGAKRKILDEVLAYTATKHITGPSFADLAVGAIDSVLVLLDARDAIGTTFPSLRDEAAVARFRTFLEEKKALARHRHRSLRRPTVWHDIIEPIYEMNDQTVFLPDEVITHALAEGAVSDLDDFTSIIWPYDKETFSRNTKGNFFGVGIQIALQFNAKLKRDELHVVSPLPDSPAYRAGVKADDIIATVDDQPTDRWSLDRAVREITGPEKTVVTLGIKRDGHEALILYPITRARIEIQSVRGWQLIPDGSGQWEYWIDRDHRIGYIRLSQFIPETADDLDQAFNAMQRDGKVEALILDLRYNPGGLLKSAIEISDRFIERGEIVSTVGANRIRTTPAFRAQRRNTQRQVPVAILINQHSASASEIVAGALQDWHKGTIVGVRSFGKGSVQDLFPLDHRKAYLKLTTQYYMLPHGRIIHREPTATQWGIDPDLQVKMTNEQTRRSLEFRREADVLRTEEEIATAAREPVEDDADDQRIHTAEDILAESLDPQLQTALLLLKTRLLSQRFAVTQSAGATADAAADVGN